MCVHVCVGVCVGGCGCGCGCMGVCMVMPVVCWVVLFRYGWAWFLRRAARLLSVDVRPSPLPACLRARMCVIWWSFRGVHGGVFMVCEMVVAVLFCLSRCWCVYSLLGSTSPVRACGVHAIACACLSACSS